MKKFEKKINFKYLKIKILLNISERYKLSKRNSEIIKKNTGGF